VATIHPLLLRATVFDKKALRLSGLPQELVGETSALTVRRPDQIYLKLNLFLEHPPENTGTGE